MENDWLSTQFDPMVALVETWGNINSFSYNREGLTRMLKAVEETFSSTLNPHEKQILDFQNGPGLLLKKRKDAPLKLFLGGHIDTVFPPEHPFQKVTYVNDRILQGPGVSDMKGGLVIMLKVIEAIELSGLSQIGWEILLNPDEEIGSPYSTAAIQQSAKRCDIGLLFEPTLADGALVSARTGSSVFQATVKGKAAHAGRHPHKGVHAIYPIARFISEIEPLHSPTHGKFMHVGTVKGGTAVNVVPDFAQCEFTIRAYEAKKIVALENKIRTIANKNGVHLHRKSQRPPKLFDHRTESVFNALKECGEKLGIPVKWQPSGGVCDGNTVAHEGIVTIDTLGVEGANQHNEEESIHLESLLEKARLTLFFINEIASGKIIIPRR